MTQTTFNFQPHSPTSRAAADAIVPAIGRLQQQVLAYLRNCPDGATDEQIINATGLSPSTARPRRIELVTKGLVRPTGRVRPTSSGRMAAVWEVVK